MTFRKIITFAILLATCIVPWCGVAQTSRLLQFEESQISVDTIKSSGGVVKLAFKCKNITDGKVLITQVRSQCGCLRPSFSKRPIEVGAVVTVYAELDPKYLYGDLSKSLTVVATNGDYNKFNTLTVTGYIDAGVTEAQVKYRYRLIGGLRSNVSAVGMRQVSRGEQIVRRMTIYNDSNVAMSLTFTKSDNTFSVEMPRILAPKEQAEIVVRMSTAAMPIGDYQKQITLSVTGLGATSIAVKGAVK